MNKGKFGTPCEQRELGTLMDKGEFGTPYEIINSGFDLFMKWYFHFGTTITIFQSEK